MDLVKNVPDMITGDNGRAPAPGYQQQFDAPGNLNSDEDSADDDEEDIGKGSETKGGRVGLDYLSKKDC